MKKLLFLTLATLAVTLLAWPMVETHAHGTDITYRSTQAIELVALYDSGEPMANAQITVFAPSDPATPWLQGEADAGGRFVFSPDPAQPGRWDVRVRTAGHGEIIHIDVAEGAVVAGGGGFTTAQRLLMSAAIIWGFVGTALYFARDKASNPVTTKGVDHAHP